MSDNQVVAAYPAEVNLDEVDVKILDISGKANWNSIAEYNYKAASVPQWGGSVCLVAADIASDMLGNRLCLTGPGTAPEWANMNAVISSTAWDFLAGTVTLSLGHDWSAPEFADAIDGAASDEEYPTTAGDIPGSGPRDDSIDASWDSWPTSAPSSGLLGTEISTSPTSPCDTCPKLEQFRALVQEVLQHNKAALGGSASQDVQSNAWGTVKVRATWNY